MPIKEESGVLGCLRWAGASRPMPGQEICGDAFFIEKGDSRLALAVADGLGHGPEASKAAELALRVFRGLGDQPLDEAIAQVHHELRVTRGCVAFFGRIDLPSLRLEGASIGDIGFRARPGWPHSVLSVPGVLGHSLRKVKVFEAALEKGDFFTVFSDGVSRKFDLAALASKEPGDQVLEVLEKHGSERDDATILLVKIGEAHA